MHLLPPAAGGPTMSGEPVDLRQDPADIVFLSAADTELAGIAAARERLASGGRLGGVTLRLASLLHFQHPFTVDLYLDRTACRSRLVIARFLGGEAYWSYALEQFAERLRQAGAEFVALPGDERREEALLRRTTLPASDQESLWQYLVQGGGGNYEGFLLHAASVLDGRPRPPAARPPLRAGIYAPGEGVVELPTLQAALWQPDAPTVAVVFYRALLQGGDLLPVDSLVEALCRRGMNPLPVFVSSLKDVASAAVVERCFRETLPRVVLNTTSFAVSAFDATGRSRSTPLDAHGSVVLQVTLSTGRLEDWRDGRFGLSPRDLAMGVALPEVDGRVYARAVSFKREAKRDEACQCSIARQEAVPDRVAFVAELARNWAQLASLAPEQSRVALVLANYPNRDGRMANGVGLDTPASVAVALDAMRREGWRVDDAPSDAGSLMELFAAGPTNWLSDRESRRGGEQLELAAYRQHFEALPSSVREAVTMRWGDPAQDPFVRQDRFRLAVHRFGNVVLGLQPARGYNIDPKSSYHDPDLAPPHNYLAFCFWIRHVFAAHVLLQFGKHGNLEWLPGKSLAMSETCFPEVALGPLPHVYPFIVNDPGEGTQAKRRAQAVIVDHLTPPIVRAGTYGTLADIERLMDEFYLARDTDARRARHLGERMLELAGTESLHADAGLSDEEDRLDALQKLDAFLCDIKESRIRDGLHVFGRSPEGGLRAELAASLATLPRAGGVGADESVLRALADDLGLSEDGFDPLGRDFAKPWIGPRPSAMLAMSDEPWRSRGDTIERLELLATAMIAGDHAPDPCWLRTAEVLRGIGDRLLPAIDGCGAAEIGGLLSALRGRHVAPGPSGAPSRGRLDVLPTGRNFHSLDSRAVPTEAAWALGFQSASLLVERYAQDHGRYPASLTLSMWGTANMRTGGDDVAQALALLGVRPEWDAGSGRVVGFEVMSTSSLGRPRVDVTVRISGFFRDAFPAQVALMDQAARAVMRLDEPEGENPLAARFRREAAERGERRAGARVFGSKPGAYGAGLQALMDESVWTGKADLADAYLAWGGYAYGERTHGEADRESFETRLRQSEGVVHNQDNREHDLLDSDDYYQFEGGAAAAITHLRGAAPPVYHNDHSRPERPVIRRLEEEISRVMRARVANPRWIEGVMRHGYKGAAEIAATVDYLFAFAATTGAVREHHFEMAFRSFLAEERCARFLQASNPAAFREIRERLQEAVRRGLWQPRSNSTRMALEDRRNES